MSKSILTPEFESMLNSAKTYFKKSESNKFEYHQCLVLKTSQGEELIYSFASNSIKDLINKSCSVLNQEKFTDITKILCMWEGGFIDLPAHQFLKELCNIDKTNKNAEILLKSSPDTCIYTTKKLSDIIR